MKNSNQFEAEELPDFLQEMRRDNPFKTPHNYFNALPEQIMQRIQEESTRTSQKWWQVLYTKWQSRLSPKPAWALAIVVIVAGLVFYNIPNTDSTQMLAGDFTSVEIAQYVQNHIDDFEVSDFYAQDMDDMEILGETIETDEIDPLLDDLMDDIDLETLQRIL